MSIGNQSLFDQMVTDNGHFLTFNPPVRAITVFAVSGDSLVCLVNSSLTELDQATRRIYVAAGSSYVFPTASISSPAPYFNLAIMTDVAGVATIIAIE